MLLFQSIVRRLENEISFSKGSLFKVSINTGSFNPKELCHEKTVFLLMCKTKAQVSCAITAQLISAFVFSIKIL